MIILIMFLLIYVLYRRGVSKIRRAETLEQRARRLRNAKNAAAITTILDDR